MLHLPGPCFSLSFSSRNRAYCSVFCNFWHSPQSWSLILWCQYFHEEAVTSWRDVTPQDFIFCVVGVWGLKISITYSIHWPYIFLQLWESVWSASICPCPQRHLLRSLWNTDGIKSSTMLPILTSSAVCQKVWCENSCSIILVCEAKCYMMPKLPFWSTLWDLGF